MMSYYRLFSVGVLFLLSVVSVPHVWAQQTLENPQPDSFQSGIGIISGWACNARRIEIAFNGGARQTAAYGTSRGDTQSACGDTDNGFGLLFNWNLLGDGVHTVVAYADGVEFASTTVIVTTLGEAFLRGVSDSYTLADFPDPGATRTLRWQEAQQNFVISAGSSQGGGTSGRAPQVLENPQPGSFQSGIGVISGWACDAQRIEISFNGGPTLKAGTGTSRGDTRQVCGDTDNGFGLLYNWNQLGNGSHHVVAYADGVEFARVDVTVTTLGTEFRRGLSREVTLPDFPAVGTDVVLRWQEAQQNFVLSYAVPTQRLVEVFPAPTYPAGVVIPHVAVSSLYAETPAVQASPQPSLLLAEDAGGTVLLSLANMDGGLLGEEEGEVEVSVESTAVVLVGLAAGIAVSDMTRSIAAAIVQHRQYPALVAALSTRMAADTHFLDRLYDEPEDISRIQEMAVDALTAAIPQALVSSQSPPHAEAPHRHPAPPAQDARTQASGEGSECEPGEVITDTPSRQTRIESAWDLVHTFINSEAAQKFWSQRTSTFRKYPHYATCMQEQEREWLADYGGPSVPTQVGFERQGPFRQLKGTFAWLTQLVGWEAECGYRRLPRPLWSPTDYAIYATVIETAYLCPFYDECPGKPTPQWVRVGIEGWKKASAEYKKLLKEVEQGEMQCEEEEEEEPKPEEEDEEEPHPEEEEEAPNPEDEEEEPDLEEEDEEEEECYGECAWRAMYCHDETVYCNIYIESEYEYGDTMGVATQNACFRAGYISKGTPHEIFIGWCRDLDFSESYQELRGEYATCDDCEAALPTDIRDHANCDNVRRCDPPRGGGKSQAIQPTLP